MKSSPRLNDLSHVHPQVLLRPEEVGGEESGGANPAVRFLLERVVSWLGQEGRRDCPFLVEMVFSSLRCCTRQETTRILNHITMVTAVLRQARTYSCVRSLHEHMFMSCELSLYPCSLSRWI